MKTKREFTEKEIINSKGYAKGFAQYPTPNILFDGLLKKEPKKYEMQINASHEQININEDETENISFGRIDVLYYFNIDDEIKYNVGLIIALDKGKPIAKIYSGVQVKACLNLCIFGAEQITKFDNISISGDGYKKAFIDEFNKTKERIEKAFLIMKTLKAIKLTPEKIERLNGAILANIIANNGIAGSNAVVNGIKLQNKKDSKYYYKDGLNAWLYYNSLTEYLNEKTHILDIPEKALNIFSAVKEILTETNEKAILKIEDVKQLN